MAKMNTINKKGYKTWKDQRQRCSNPKNPRFYCYGAKGIKVEYSSREFIAWHEKEYKKRDTWNRAQCGRIDHSKHYSLKNIELVECSENTKERNQRLGNPTPSHKIKIMHHITKEIKEFPSLREAARVLNISHRAFHYQSRNVLKRKPTSGWILLDKQI